MNNPERGPSRRFQPTTWTERLVPVLLVILLVLLLGTIILVLLSILGVIA